jgi:hypothetical protein
MRDSSRVNQGTHIGTPQGVSDCRQRLLPEPKFQTPSGRLVCNHLTQSRTFAFVVKQFVKKPGLTGLNRAIPGCKGKLFFCLEFPDARIIQSYFPRRKSLLAMSGNWLFDVSSVGGGAADAGN